MASAETVEAAPAAPLPSSLKRSHDDIATPTTPQPTKRAKVTFSPNVEVRTIQITAEKEGKPLALIQEEVRLALDRHRHKDDTRYNQLKHVFMAHPSEEAAPTYTELRRYLAAVTAQAYHMGECGGLVFAVLESRWLERDRQIWIDVQRFLAALLTAHTTYLPSIMNWLVDQFTEATVTPLPGANQRKIYNRVHDTMLCLQQYCPNLREVLGAAIKARFPFFRAKSKTYLAYIHNLFRVGQNIPSLQNEMLRIMMDKLLAIDVQIGASVDDLDDEDMELLQSQVEADFDKLIAGKLDDDAEAEFDDPEDEQAKSLKALKTMKDDMLKLDAVLTLLFQHFHSALGQLIVRSRENPELKKAHNSPYQVLLSTFTSSILPTYNTRHLQYMLFRFSQEDPDFYNDFTNALINSAFNRDQQLMLRMSSISYLASFVSRGAQVSKENVLALFTRFSTELDTLRQKLEPTSKGPDPDKYRFYYTLFQGCMYIFCFRWRDFLVSDPEDIDDETTRKWLPLASDTFTIHMHSRLNPLKVCAPLIVDMFAKVTKSLSFLYIYSILETNKRVRLSRATTFGTVARETVLTLKTNESSLKLDAHYAFEPYLLPTSKKWVDEEFYVSFSKVAPPGMLDDEDEEDSSEDEDDEDDDEEDEYEK